MYDKLPTKAILILLAFSGLVYITLLNNKPVNDNVATVITKEATVIAKPAPVLGQHFTLVDQNEVPFSSKSLLGKYSLLYFGFTRCSEICPLTLQKLDQAVSYLRHKGIDNVEIVFITVDPARDDATSLAEYLSHFDNKIIGLTGSQQDLQKVADSFKVFVNKLPSSIADATNYQLNHTSLTYLMDKDFNCLTSFNESSTAIEISAYLEQEVSH